MTGRDDATIAAFRQAIAEELDSRQRIDPDIHDAHHAWTQLQMDRQKRREDRREKVIQHLLGLGAAVGLGWLGSIIFKAIGAALNSSTPPPH